MCPLLCSVQAQEYFRALLYALNFSLVTYFHFLLSTFT